MVSKGAWRWLVIGYALATCIYALIAVLVDDVSREGLVVSLVLLGVLLVLLKTGGVGLGRLVIQYSERPILFSLMFLTYLLAAVAFFVLAFL